MVEYIEITGLRGFQLTQKLTLANPNGKLGSGLTVLVGPNGGGKSTVVEAFRQLARESVKFSEGRRNKLAQDRVTLTVRFDNKVGTLRTVDAGGSETVWDPSNLKRPAIYAVASRRVFNPYFSENNWDRTTYRRNVFNEPIRGAPADVFSSRLFSALRDYKNFSAFFDRVYGKKLQWTIDQSDQNHHYLKIQKPGNQYHNSDGLGEGVVSLLFLVDAIYGATEDELIVIDEPELSLHPQLQRRLMDEILTFTARSQLVLATHSPEMVNVEAIMNGGTIARVAETSMGCTIFQLGQRERMDLQVLQHDVYNPHNLGYDARSCFFADDNLVVTEGQEDVVCLEAARKTLGTPIDFMFWGYGAGGAGNIERVTRILTSLGFEKVGALFDGDKRAEAEQFQNANAGIPVWILPTPDIRDKCDKSGNVMKVGVCDSGFGLKPEWRDKVHAILSDMHTKVGSQL